MKLFSAQQIREWDQFTIQNEPILSLDLMERAAAKCADWIHEHLAGENQFVIFSGIGNNGGDGLAIARMLQADGKEVALYILGDPEKASTDFKDNYKLWKQTSGATHILREDENFSSIALSDKVIIDAVFGSGLDRPVSGWRLSLFQAINNAKAIRISVDIPSGIPADPSSAKSMMNYPSIEAHFTLTFQQKKRSFFTSPADTFCGEVVVLDIGLDDSFYEKEDTNWRTISIDLLKRLHSERPNQGHKGTFGKTLLVAGSRGMMGAAQLATKACLQSGTGLVQVHVPQVGEQILQVSCPEAMVQADQHEDMITRVAIDQKVTVLGIGPGMGQNDPSVLVLENLLDSTLPKVIDADALNLIASSELLREKLKASKDAVITPHPGEFDRLFGAHACESDRLVKAIEMAKEWNVVIVLKGHFTKVVSPQQEVYVNTLGSPALAVGGSGDVLTGLMSGMLADGTSPVDAAVMAVGLHGWLGFNYEKEFGTKGLTAGWLAEHIRDAWKELRSE